ncbi:hypothetical protein BPAE_0380g00010 [Botrytis paeoniae]|uniref:Uncharacterized protein n=1 Tax=Botrytis paeoniae TaxID=278948 RepID=A0A4Z1F435_9HELO|nr:hypothetical protein BPAE_0380g00010 [Botrytis paeoniae]
MLNQSEKEESSVRDGPPVARDRSPASGSDPPNLVVSDRAEPDHGRSASGSSLYGPLRAGNPLRGRPPNPHDPYDMNRYHAINEKARTSYPVNSDTNMNNGPASNLPPYNSASANSTRGDSPCYSLHPQAFEWNPAFMTDQTHPYSIVLRRPIIASPAPAPATASAAVPATRMTAAPAPAPAPLIAPAVPVTRCTRSRTQKQTSAAIKINLRKPATRKPAAKKPAAKKSTAKRPWKGRSGFGIFRVKITEVELVSIRLDYGTLLPRKKAFKDALPGAYVKVEITFDEIKRLWSNRDNGAEERQAYYDNPKTEKMKEAMLKASASYEKKFEERRAKARSKGYPDAMPLTDRFPVVALAAASLSVAPVVAGNAADSTEDQEMADDDSVSPESSFYGESEDEDMEEE